MELINIVNRGARDLIFKTSLGDVVIGGRNRSLILGASEYISRIREDAWNEITETWGHNTELAMGIIFADKKIENAKAFAKEMRKEKLADSPVDEEHIKKIKTKAKLD